MYNLSSIMSYLHKPELFFFLGPAALDWEQFMQFATKIIIAVRDDLQPWQELNITAFLMSGIVAETPNIIGKGYKDSEGNNYSAISSQPVIILYGSSSVLRNMRMRALSRDVNTAVYIEEMFETGHDEANRLVFSEHGPNEGNTVGVAYIADKKIADKISKGAKMHK